MRLVVRQVILAENGGETSSETGETGETGGETGPALANSPTMHSRVVCKDPKPFFLNVKITAELNIYFVSY